MRILLRPLARFGRRFIRTAGLVQANPLVGASVLWTPPRARVMALAPHMDDETIGCGGTLALHAMAGSDVRVVFLTDGRYGSPELRNLFGKARARREEELVITRKEEARRALATLGIGHHLCLDERDGSLEAHKALVSKLRALLVDFRPEYVYLPFFLDNHPDHIAVSHILLDAAAGAGLGFTCVAYEVWTPLWPNCVVRIDSVVDRKREALREYESQNRHGDFGHRILGLNAYRSMSMNLETAQYAEAFCMLPVRQYRRLVSNHASPSRGDGEPVVTA